MVRKSKRSSKTSKPIVLIVDDGESDADATATLLRGHVSTISREPDHVINEDLARSDLVLMDFKLEDWPSREKLLTPSLKPQNGIALAAVLKSNLPSSVSSSPTAFALRSGQLEHLSGELTYEGREQIVAKLNEFEWIFSKSENPEFPTQVRALADAVRKLPHPWPTAESRRNALIELLKLRKNVRWFSRAIDDVERAHPPQDEAAQATKGLAVLRWLAHEILPYPGPLLDDRYLAARLRILPTDLRTALESSRTPSAAAALRPYEYRGILGSFLGRRWWRAGVEQWLWEITKGRPNDPSALQIALGKCLSKKLKLVEMNEPVVSVDDQFRPTDKLIELKDAVQLNPDGWPSFSDGAWIPIDDAINDDRIASRVAVVDKHRLVEGAKV